MAFSRKINEEYMNKMKSHFSLAYRNENSFRGPSDTTKQTRNKNTMQILPNLLVL